MGSCSVGRVDKVRIEGAFIFSLAIYLSVGKKSVRTSSPIVVVVAFLV